MVSVDYLRDICSWKMLSMPIHMASVGKVMTDGSVIVNPKYSTCRGLCQHQKWVFGIYNLEIKDGFIRLVQKREVGSWELSFQSVNKRCCPAPKYVVTNAWCYWCSISTSRTGIARAYAVYFPVHCAGFTNMSPPVSYTHLTLPTILRV